MLFPRRIGGPLSPMPRSTSSPPLKLPCLPEFTLFFRNTGKHFEPLAIQVRVLLQELCAPITIFSKATVFCAQPSPHDTCIGTWTFWKLKLDRKNLVKNIH